jgi:putative inorganic carbon (hco3(-)) transporter
VLRARGRLSLPAVYVAAIAIAALGGWLTSISPLIALAALAGALLAYVVWARPNLFVLVMIALLPWQGALRFPTHSLTIVKLVGALLFLSVLFATLVKDRRLRFTPTIGWAVLTCTAVTLSLLANGPSGESTTEALRYWSLALFLFLVVQLIDTRESLLRAIRVLALSAIVGAVWATVQFLDGSVARASGPISDPNDFGYFLAAVLPLVVYLFLTEPRRRWLWGAGLASLVLGILGSSSRGAFVALAVTALWALCTGRIPLRAVLGAVAIAALLAVLALDVSSSQTAHNLQIRQNSLTRNVSLREIYWSAAWRMSLEHPLFGIGPGRFEEVSPAYLRNTPVREREVAVNDTYLAMLSETGVLATLAFLGFLVATWRQILLATRGGAPAERSERARARPGETSAPLPLRLLRGTLLASFLIAVVGGIFFSSQLSTPFWLIAALACAIASQAGESTRGQPREPAAAPPSGLLGQ